MEEFSILTLNCWGLKWIAKQKDIRIHAIAETLANYKVDVIVCQELWCESDFETIKATLNSSFPFAKRFDGGCVGTGLAAFSTHTINATLFIPFQPNGKYWKLHHADWYAAKGVGLVRIKTVGGLTVNVMTTHTHVEAYGGEYRAHRVCQALTMADFIDTVADSADLTILAGDLNSRPNEELIRLLLALTDLKDAWITANSRYSHPSLEGGPQIREQQSLPGSSESPEVEPSDRPMEIPQITTPPQLTTPQLVTQFTGPPDGPKYKRKTSLSGIPISKDNILHTRDPIPFAPEHDIAGGFTCDIPQNSYTAKKHIKHLGSRLDYILYCGRKGVIVESLECGRPLPNRIPSHYGVDCSLSDHEALVAKLLIRNPNAPMKDKGCPSRKMSSSQVDVATADAMRIAGSALTGKIRSTQTTMKGSIAFAIVLLAVILGTLWLPSEWNKKVYVTVPANIVRVLLGAGFFVSGFLHPIMMHTEINCLKRAIESLRVRAKGDETLLSTKYLD